MDIKIKKIVAREGLIIFGFIVGGFTVAFISDYIWQHNKAYIDMMASSGYYQYEPLSLRLFLNRALSLFSIFKFPSNCYAFPHPYSKFWFPEWTEHLGEFIFLYGYLIYLFIRFVLWATRVLRQKS